MDKFERELQIGEIHLRDRWQFELKSDFTALPGFAQQLYTQEFYIFIPNALQINRENYTQDDFFKDQTNLIRYKTPAYSLRELVDKHEHTSPLQRLAALKQQQKNFTDLHSSIAIEAKLLASIVRSCLRKEVSQIAQAISHRDKELFERLLLQLLKDWKLFYSSFIEVKEDLCSHLQKDAPYVELNYVDEFICNSASYYFTSLLKLLKSNGMVVESSLLDSVSRLIEKVDQTREGYFAPYHKLQDKVQDEEVILYRQNMLDKWIMEVFKLEANRTPLVKKYHNLIGSMAAGVAMLFFLIFYIGQGALFAQETSPWILLTIIFYIMKDRIKEALRDIPSIQGFSWLSHYRTEIYAPNSNHCIGTLSEFFSLLDPSDLPEEIVKVRNRQFHTLLESFERPETVVYYKNRAQFSFSKSTRRRELNVVSRFNLARFVSKAANPFQPYTVLLRKEAVLQQLWLPKVYHINIIMKNSFIGEAGKKVTELKKYRLVVDKNEIKRVEQL